MSANIANEPLRPSLARRANGSRLRRSRKQPTARTIPSGPTPPQGGRRHHSLAHVGAGTGRGLPSLGRVSRRTCWPHPSRICSSPEPVTTARRPSKPAGHREPYLAARYENQRPPGDKVAALRVQPTVEPRALFVGTAGEVPAAESPPLARHLVNHRHDPAFGVGDAKHPRQPNQRVGSDAAGVIDGTVRFKRRGRLDCHVTPPQDGRHSSVRLG